MGRQPRPSGSVDRWRKVLSIGEQSGTDPIEVSREVRDQLSDWIVLGLPAGHPEFITIAHKLIRKMDDSMMLDRVCMAMIADPLLFDAVHASIEEGQSSMILLQRRFGIGYTRASGLIDLMVRCGLIVKHANGQGYVVTITADGWKRVMDAMGEMKDA